MFSESDLLPISALQHLAFCVRQCALIHLEQMWAENRFTAEGRVLHERVHEQESESRNDLRIARGLRLHSLRLGLVGIADVVEFRRIAPDAAKPGAATVNGVSLAGAKGFWQPYPVEYKRGKPKPDRCDQVQLCAQALCLEEMLGVDISSAAIFYGRPRRRSEVAIDASLREETEALADHLHELSRLGVTPVVEYSSKCRSCSLLDYCRPKATGSPAAASRYIQACVRNLTKAESAGEEVP